MSDNRIMCPYCMREEIFWSNGICNSCYEKVGELEQSRWSSWRELGYAPLMAVACKIDEEFQFLEEFWEEISSLDEFHFRRIICVLEMFDQVEDSYFLPATKEEIRHYKDAIKEYVNQTMSYDELTDIAKSIPKRNVVMANAKDSLLYHGLYSEFFSFWCGEEILDWSYSQYFEISVANLMRFISHEVLMAVLKKHFDDVLAKPVRRIIGDM
ncbi:hypothetical protein EII17_04340 [Clostridiales bacterium COT073_COT-073]|nr:hypothetical protein EII17_04340 [Clostridiales bacterium COT073_COT-073]